MIDECLNKFKTIPSQKVQRLFNSIDIIFTTGSTALQGSLNNVSQDVLRSNKKRKKTSLCPPSCPDMYGIFEWFSRWFGSVAQEGHTLM